MAPAYCSTWPVCWSTLLEQKNTALSLPPHIFFSTSFASPYQSIPHTAPRYELMTHIIYALLMLSLTNFHWVGWKAPVWSKGLLWDLQDMHGSCKEQQRGTARTGIPWSCTGRRERLRVKQLWFVSLVSSAAHHNGAETLYDAVPLKISWKAALMTWCPEWRAGNYSKDVNTPMHLGHHLLPP